MSSFSLCVKALSSFSLYISQSSLCPHISNLYILFLLFFRPFQPPHFPYSPQSLYPFLLLPFPPHSFSFSFPSNLFPRPYFTPYIKSLYPCSSFFSFTCLSYHPSPLHLPFSFLLFFPSNPFPPPPYFSFPLKPL